MPSVLSNPTASTTWLQLACVAEAPARIEIVGPETVAGVTSNITQPDPTIVNEFQVTLVLPRTAAGNYSVRVTSINMCTALANDLVRITADNSVTISSWSPSHARNGSLVSGIALSAPGDFVGPPLCPRFT